MINIWFNPENSQISKTEKREKKCPFPKSKTSFSKNAPKVNRYSTHVLVICSISYAIHSPNLIIVQSGELTQRLSAWHRPSAVTCTLFQSPDFTHNIFLFCLLIHERQQDRVKVFSGVYNFWALIESKDIWANLRDYLMCPSTSR